MAFTVPATDPHVQAITDFLEANDVGVLVGRGRKPPGAGWQGTPGQSRFVGYMVVQAPTGTDGGPAGDPSADAVWMQQITCVGATVAQADQIADLAAVMLLRATSAQLAIPSRRLMQPIRREVRGAARPDPTLGDTQTLYLATPIFRVWTTPT